MRIHLTGLSFSLLLTLFGSVFVKTAYAQVVINEFCPNCSTEWVELYNLTTDPIDLEGWELQDGNSISSDDLTITKAVEGVTVIQPQGFMVISYAKDQGWLNNSGEETLKLFDNSAATDPVDSFSFSSTQKDKTYSRIPDGTGSFSSGTNPTQGTYNQAPPSPTPSPTPTLAPTATPKPLSPTPTTKPSPTSTLHPTPTPPDSTQESTADDEQTLVLGEASNPSPTPTEVSQAKPYNPPLFPLIAAFFGVCLLLSAVFMLLRHYLVKPMDGTISGHE